MNYTIVKDIAEYLDDCDKQDFINSYRDKFSDIRFKLCSNNVYSRGVIYITNKHLINNQPIINISMWCKPININYIYDIVGNEGYTLRTKKDGFVIISVNLQIDNDIAENIAEIFTVLRNI